MYLRPISFSFPLAHLRHVFSSCHRCIIKLQSVSDEVTYIWFGTAGTLGTNAGRLLFYKVKYELR